MKQKIFNYFALTLSTLGALLIFALLIAWGVSLPKTALLWVDGPAAGWAFLLIFATIAAFLVWLPAIIIIDEIKINNNKKH